MKQWYVKEFIIVQTEALWCPCDYGQVFSETTSLLKHEPLLHGTLAVNIITWTNSLSFPSISVLPLPYPPSLIPSLSIFPKISVAQHQIFFGYGPLPEEGYGVGFIPQDDQILFGISSFRHAQHPDTGTKQYIQKLRESMTEMHDIMMATGSHTSKLWYQWPSQCPSVVIVTIAIVSCAWLLSIISML